MSAGAFVAGDWVDRLVTALAGLAKAQERFLQEYWQHNPRKHVVIDGRDVTPFPLDDLRMVYAEVRYSKRLGKEKYYASLRTALDLARHALLSHPTLARVAVAGRVIGDNDFWIRILNSGLSISAADLIAGLMARAAELSGDRFRTAARELNAFFSPVEEGEAAGVLGNLDEGCDAMLFYGLTVTDRTEVAEGMAIVPFREVQRFVNADLVEELAPSGAGFHGWRSVGAIVRPFRWRPVFRRMGSVNEPMTAPPGPFFREARIFLDLLAVSHAAPGLPLATISNCIDRSASRLLGQESHGPGSYQSWTAKGLDGFAECPVLTPEALQEAREAFEKRESGRYERMAPFVGRLAQALGRHGRFAAHDKIVDVSIALEGMYELPKWKKSRKLENRVSGFLGTDAEDRARVRESVRTFYNARSDIVHSGSGDASPFRNGAAFVTGFELARRSLFKVLREGSPEDWDKLAVAGG